MKRQVYILEVNAEHLRLTLDMLRYDECFEAQRKGEVYHLCCLKFTRERWQSFGVIPRVVTSYGMTAAEEKKNWAKARGFYEGIRFVQTLLALSTLVQ